MTNLVNSVRNVSDQSWSSRNQKTLGQSAVVFGIALFAISIGYVATTLSSINTPDLQGIDQTSRNSINAVDFNQGIGGVVFIPAAIGALIMIEGGCILYKYNKKQKAVSHEEAKIKKNVKKWKTLPLVLGFAFAMFGLGMVIASTFLLKYQIPAIKDLINNHPHGYWQPADSWWQSLNATWLDPTQTQLNLFLASGIFAVIAGGGLMVAGVGTTTIKEKWNLWRAKIQPFKAKQMENETL